MTKMNEKERFDHKNAADYLGIAKQTWYNWRGQRRGPDYTLMGRKKKKKKIDLDKFIEPNRVELSQA